MKRITIAASAIGLAMVGIAWLAEAKLDPAAPPPHLLYNPQVQVYQLQDLTSFANQTLEQKMLTIKSISRHEGLLADKDRAAGQ